METRNEKPVVAAEAVANNTSSADETAAVVVNTESTFASDVEVADGVAYDETLTVRNVKIHPSEEDGVGATIALTFKEDVDGYKVNRETHLKEFGKVNRISFFLSEVIKTLANDFVVGAWLKSKTNEQLQLLLPVILMGSKVKTQNVHDKPNTRVLRELKAINLADEFKNKMMTSVLDLI